MYEPTPTRLGGLNKFSKS